MSHVVGLTSLGGAYRRGMRVPGWGIVKLSDGSELYCPESANYFEAMLDRADELGHDTTEMRRKVDHWVQTGSFELPLEAEKA